MVWFLIEEHLSVIHTSHVPLVCVPCEPYGSVKWYTDSKVFLREPEWSITFPPSTPPFKFFVEYVQPVPEKMRRNVRRNANRNPRWLKFISLFK